ncbi:hypothetical protein V3C99_008309 [Haemonchus contortus]
MTQHKRVSCYQKLRWLRGGMVSFRMPDFHHSRRSEMSRVSDNTSYHKLMTAPIASLNSLMLQTCSPSTATATHTPVTDLTSSLACSLLSCSIPSATMISPPPPYHSINHHRPYHNIHPLFDIHNPAAIVESDVDVIGLSQSTKQVSIRDHDSENNDEPLDLSLKSSTSSYSPTTSRPSVIIESPTVRHPPVRRSASSVSSSREHDVHEHFRRSLSGKWPRRSKTDDEKARASPITRRTSFNSHGSSNCTTQPHVIVSNSGVDIVDHFRRALSEKDFENWQRKRNATNATNEPSK